MSRSYLHYDIIEKLGEGGMGLVYLAKDTKLNRLVALKFLPKRISDDPVERKRFKQEASAAAALSHPNVAQVYAIEEAGTDIFIVMEYVKGDVLNDLSATEKLPIEQKERIALQIAEGLKAAHDHDIVHRDIKSGNIMVSDTGLVKVMDFGLARVRGAEHITKPGSTVGTTSYMAPEQIAGEECDIRSDIWSYGIVLYELFTSVKPFQGVYEPAIMYAIMEEEPQPFAKSETNIPAYMQHIIAQCLEKKPADRYQNLQEVVDQLNAQEVNSTKSKAKTRSSPLPFSINKSALAGVLTVVAIAIFLVYWQKSSSVKNLLPDKKYLAVLPIEIIGDSPGLRAISEGLSETFSYRLSALEKFENSYWVAPASEMRRENIKSATQAKKLFGINLAVVSSIQLLRDSTRFTLELVDADKMRRIGSRQLIIPSNELARLEFRAVEAMLTMLEINISDTVRSTFYKGNTSVPDAYEYYLKGIAALQDNTSLDSLATAKDLFRQAIELDPQFALAYAGLGESYWQTYQSNKDIAFLEKAEKEMTKSVQLNENLAQVQTSLGLLKTTGGKYDDAIASFNRALAIDPKYTPAHRGLAQAYDYLGDEEKAISTYKYAITLKPDYWETYKDLGAHYLQKGKFALAIEQFQKVTHITPANSSAYSNLGVAYYYDGQMDQARAMFERSLALEKNPLTANNLAGIYYWQGDYEKAADMYLIALNEFSDRYEIWGNLAAAYDLSNQSEKAKKYYRTAIRKAEEQLRINPNDARVLADLGAYHSDLGNRQQALQYISKALGMGKNDIMIRQRAVSAYEKLGLRDMALEWITAAMINDLEMQPELHDLINDPQYISLKTNLALEQ